MESDTLLEWTQAIHRLLSDHVSSEDTDIFNETITVGMLRQTPLRYHKFLCPVAQLNEAMENKDDLGGILMRVGVVIDRVMRSGRSKTPPTIFFPDRNVPAIRRHEEWVILRSNLDSILAAGRNEDDCFGNDDGLRRSDKAQDEGGSLSSSKVKDTHTRL
jgi:hypothetical protein